MRPIIACSLALIAVIFSIINGLSELFGFKKGVLETILSFMNLLCILMDTVALIIVFSEIIITGKSHFR